MGTWTQVSKKEHPRMQQPTLQVLHIAKASPQWMALPVDRMVKSNSTKTPRNEGGMRTQIKMLKWPTLTNWHLATGRRNPRKRPILNLVTNSKPKYAQAFPLRQSIAHFDFRKLVATSRRVASIHMPICPFRKQLKVEGVVIKLVSPANAEHYLLSPF